MVAGGGVGISAPGRGGNLKPPRSSLEKETGRVSEGLKKKPKGL